MKITFNYGKTVQPEEMAKKSIYLDGACRGPVIDNEKQSYSFDHHADCLRFATLATCQQVRLALELGLNPADFEVHVNDLDADTTFSIWLLLNPVLCTLDQVVNMTDQIGFVDSHGPVRTPTQLHRVLSHPPNQEQNEAMLKDDLEQCAIWYAKGDSHLRDPSSFPTCRAFGITTDGSLWDSDDDIGTVADFAEAYANGLAVAVLCPDGTDGTTGYTVGKRSDFVDYDIPAFLARMNALEPGWGGGSTIGGAPRGEGGKRSVLSVEEVRVLLGSSSSPKLVFVAAFLDDASQRLLREEFNDHEPIGDWKGTHATLLYKPDPTQLDGIPWGQELSLEIRDWNEDEKCVVAKLEKFDFPMKLTNRTPHITICCEKGVAATYANELVEASWTDEVAKMSSHPIKLTAHIGWKDQHQSVHFVPPRIH